MLFFGTRGAHSVYIKIFVDTFTISVGSHYLFFLFHITGEIKIWCEILKFLTYLFIKLKRNIARQPLCKKSQLI